MPFKRFMVIYELKNVTGFYDDLWRRKKKRMFQYSQHLVCPLLPTFCLNRCLSCYGRMSFGVTKKLLTSSNLFLLITWLNLHSTSSTIIIIAFAEGQGILSQVSIIFGAAWHAGKLTLADNLRPKTLLPCPRHNNIAATNSNKSVYIHICRMNRSSCVSSIWMAAVFGKNKTRRCFLFASMLCSYAGFDGTCW